MMIRIVSLSLLFACVLAAASASEPYRAIPVKDGGAVKGRVTLASASEKSEKLAVSQDQRICGAAKPSPCLATGKGGAVAHALVYLETIREGKDFPASGTYVLDQRGCQYSPHVSVVPVGARMEILNSDPILHNVHTYTTDAKTVFNIAQPMKGVRTKTRVFDTPGILRATCDAGHPWMLAYVAVAPHPYYAVTDAEGNYTLTDIPPGTYTLKFWHEGVRLAGTDELAGKVRFYKYEEPYEMSQEVVVTAGATATANFSLTLRSPK
jgi:plastocyanin